MYGDFLLYGFRASPFCAGLWPASLFFCRSTPMNDHDNEGAEILKRLIREIAPCSNSCFKPLFLDGPMGIFSGS